MTVKKIFTAYHPILISIFPVLSLYLYNIDQVEFTSLLPPLGAGLLVGLVFWGLSGLIIKSLIKSALWTSFFLLIFYSFGRIPVGSPIILLTISLVLITAGFLFLLNSNRDFQKLNLFFNVFGLVLVGSVLVQILPYEYARARKSDRTGLQPVKTAKKTDNRFPDIYYLIFDRYPNADVLKKYFNFDNSRFLTDLEDYGFYVANQSYANYPKTFNSLASSLNLEYLDFLVDEFGENYTDRSPFYRLINNNKVIQFLEKNGYTTYHFGDWWQPTRLNHYAEFNYNYFIVNLNEFTKQLIGTTLAAPLYSRYLHSIQPSDQTGQRIVPDKEFSYVSPKQEVIQRTDYRMSKITKTAGLAGPKFVFAHILLPHDPFIFDADCQPAEEEAQKYLERDEKFVNQLQCTNRLIKEKIDRILSVSPTEPVIIIQADEGPFPKTIWSGEKAYGELEAEEIERKFGILNAYYLPGFDQEDLYPSVSPVNSFRIVFNHYFGTDYEILEDRHFNIQSEKTPYQMYEVSL